MGNTASIAMESDEKPIIADVLQENGPAAGAEPLTVIPLNLFRLAVPVATRLRRMRRTQHAQPVWVAVFFTILGTIAAITTDTLQDTGLGCDIGKHQSNKDGSNEF